MRYTFTLEKFLNLTLSALIFLFPWQTIWIYKEQSLNGFKWEYGTLGFYASEVLLWVVVGLFILMYLRRAKFSISNYQLAMTKDRVFVVSVLLFLLYCFGSSLWAIDGDVAFQQALRIMEVGLLFFVLLLAPYDTEKILRWFVAGAAVQSTLGIWQFLTQSTFASVLLGLPLHVTSEPGTSVIQFGLERWMRAYGAFPHPNVFGGYLVVSLFATGWLLLSPYQTSASSVESGEREGVNNFSKLFRFSMTPAYRQAGHLTSPDRGGIKTFLTVSFFLQIAVLFFTFSRSAWLSAGIVFMFSCFHVLKQRKFFYHVSGLLLFIVLTATFFPIVTARTHETSSASRSVAERISGYNEAIKLFFEHPLVGVGVGNYTAALHARTPSLPGYVYQPVHNVPLLFFVETGIVGILLLISVLYFFSLYQSSFFRLQSSVFLLPLFLLDHYLYSSWVGLLLTAFFLGIVLRVLPEENHGEDGTLQTARASS